MAIIELVELNIAIFATRADKRGLTRVKRADRQLSIKRSHLFEENKKKKSKRM